MIEAVEQFLYAQCQEEPVEAAVIMVWSLNPQDRIDQAVPVLAKYLSNIQQNPTDPKYRRIRVSNKVFVEKIKDLKGAVEFLKGVGFLEDDQRTAEGTVETYLSLPEPDQDALARVDDALLALEQGGPVSLKLYRDPKVRSCAFWQFLDFRNG